MGKVIVQRTGLSRESFQLIMSLCIPFRFVEHVMSLHMEPCLIIGHSNAGIQDVLIDCSSVSLKGGRRLRSQTKGWV